MRCFFILGSCIPGCICGQEAAAGLPRDQLATSGAIATEVLALQDRSGLSAFGTKRTKSIAARDVYQ
jgi:hypothetical protein